MSNFLLIFTNKNKNIMYWWTGSSLVQEMVSFCFSTKTFQCWSLAKILLIFLSVGPLGTNFSEIWINIKHFLTGKYIRTWGSHQMETFSALLAICAGNSPVPGEFPAQRPVTQRFDVFFDLRLNKRLSKQWWGWWFETPSRPLWHHCNDMLSAKWWPFCSSVTVW